MANSPKNSTDVTSSNTDKMDMRSTKQTASAKRWSKLTRRDLGDKVPRRGGVVTPRLASLFLKAIGWQIVGEVPNVPKAVFLALPHTSNLDAVYAIPTLLALDLDINIMGKDSLFKNPILGKFLTWSGIIPIDRKDKGSVLQASIDKIKSSKRMHLGLSPEGTRGYTDKWKTGFYYIAKGAEVPIVPVAMDYKTKQVRFMTPVMPTDDMEADIAKIISQYKDVMPKHPENLSQPLQDLLNKDG